jgi:regulator of protease activity HflC (stomatin/prohibitin superfamily)
MNIAALGLEALVDDRRRSLFGSRARRRTTILLSVSVSLLVLAIVWHWVFVTVPAGHVGVMWYRFSGTDSGADSFCTERSYLIWPWDRMALYDARVQQASRDFDLLTRDGMTIVANIAVRFRLNTSVVGLLHKNIGPDYVETLLLPAVAAYARGIFAQNSTDDVYAIRRLAIQDEIKKTVAGDLNSDPGRSDGSARPPYLFIQDVLIKSIRFPPDVQAAVNRKMEQYQLQQEYAYRLERERLESQRKEVEAQGIARFQSIVGNGISDNYLRWKGIDATLALAQSSNSKIIVFGNAKEGMPLIMGDARAGMPAPAAEGGADPASHAPRAPPSSRIGLPEAAAPPGP